MGANAAFRSLLRPLCFKYPSHFSINLDQVHRTLHGFLENNHVDSFLDTWFLVGTAARMALGMGLHTASAYENLPFNIANLRKRIFFSIYMMDRLVVSLPRMISRETLLTFVYSRHEV